MNICVVPSVQEAKPHRSDVRHSTLAAMQVHAGPLDPARSGFTLRHQINLDTSQPLH